MSNLKEAAKLALEALTSGATDSKTRRHASEIAIASLTAALALPDAPLVPERVRLSDEEIIALSQQWPCRENDWADAIEFCQAIESAIHAKGAKQ